MKKKLAVALAAAMVAGMTGCGSGDNAASTTDGSPEATVKESEEAAEDAAGDTADAAASTEGERTTFTVGFDAEYPPYGYMDENGEYTGFDLELAQAVCDLKGWELVKTPINWDSKDMELNSGSIDCIWNGFTIDGREDDYTWSEPYINNSQVIVTAEDSGINALSDLAGKIVGVQAASAALDVLNSDDHKDLTASFGQLQEFGDYNNAFVELKAGAIDAIAMDIGVAQYQIAQREEGKFVMLQGEDNKLAVEQYAVGFLKGNDELRDTVQKTLDEMAADGTFAQIAEKWGLTDSVCLGK